MYKRQYLCYTVCKFTGRRKRTLKCNGRLYILRINLPQRLVIRHRSQPDFHLWSPPSRTLYRFLFILRIFQVLPSRQFSRIFFPVLFDLADQSLFQIDPVFLRKAQQEKEDIRGLILDLFPCVRLPEDVYKRQELGIGTTVWFELEVAKDV